jgi:hypothetical protein
LTAAIGSTSSVSPLSNSCVWISCLGISTPLWVNGMLSIADAARRDKERSGTLVSRADACGVPTRVVGCRSGLPGTRELFRLLKSYMAAESPCLLAMDGGNAGCPCVRDAASALELLS